MTKEQVFEIVVEQIRLVLPEIDGERVGSEQTLRDLGANSIDRVEIVTGTMEQLRLRVPVHELAGAKDIGTLVDILLRYHSQAAPV